MEIVIDDTSVHASQDLSHEAKQRLTVLLNDLIAMLKGTLATFAVVLFFILLYFRFSSVADPQIRASST
jgi:hypothetical protein